MKDPSETSCAKRLAKHFESPQLLRHALIHRSYCAENPGEESNERLEFLGDSVLGLVVTETLYGLFPLLPEGDLARMRSMLVSTEALAPISRELGVGDALLLGHGEETSGGREKSSILADAMEAIIGAAYLACGLDAARSLIADLFEASFEAIDAEAELGDAKNRLQELSARRGLALPRYVVSDEGPDHAKRFAALVLFGAETIGQGVGRSKKLAERAAAIDALKRLGPETPTPDA